MSLRFRLGASATLVCLVLSTGAALAQFNLRATPRPQPGDCKAAPVVAYGASAAQAQAQWIAQTSALHGSNWALWLIAADKALVPQGNNSWLAMARPCYHIPQG